MYSGGGKGLICPKSKSTNVKKKMGGVDGYDAFSPDALSLPFSFSFPFLKGSSEDGGRELFWEF